MAYILINGVLSANGTFAITEGPVSLRQYHAGSIPSASTFPAGTMIYDVDGYVIKVTDGSSWQPLGESVTADGYNAANQIAVFSSDTNIRSYAGFKFTDGYGVELDTDFYFGNDSNHTIEVKPATDADTAGTGLNITAGDGYAGGNGGNLNLTAGSTSGSTANGGTGGSINISAGDGGLGSTLGGNGGDVYVAGGQGKGAVSEHPGDNLGGTVYLDGGGGHNHGSVVVGDGGTTVSLQLSTDLTFTSGGSIYSLSTGGINLSASDGYLGFYEATPVQQPSSTGYTTVASAGSGTTFKFDSTSTGGVGSTAYTFGDVVKALKLLGLLKQ